MKLRIGLLKGLLSLFNHTVFQKYISSVVSVLSGAHGPNIKCMSCPWNSMLQTPILVRDRMLSKHIVLLAT